MMFEFGAKLALHAAGLFEPRLSIVLFHHVLERPDPLLPDEPDIDRFSTQIRWLSAAFNILPVHEAAALLYAGRLPPRTLCITFDDGYQDNVSHALPILERFGARATFFVTTRYLQGGMMWNDRVVEAIRAWPEDTMDLREHGLDVVSLGAGRAAAVDRLLPRIKYLPSEERSAVADALLVSSGAPRARLMMDADEIKTLHRAGMEIGGHTESHPILTSLTDAEAEAEISANKATLESIVGQSLATFAYPNGRPQRDYDIRHRDMLDRAGYRYALTTAVGTAAVATDPLQIPRFTPWDRDKPRYLARMVLNYFRDAESVDSRTEAA